MKIKLKDIMKKLFLLPLILITPHNHTTKEVSASFFEWKRLPFKVQYKKIFEIDTSMVEAEKTWKYRNLNGTYDFEYIIRPNSKRWRKLQDGTLNTSPIDKGNFYKGKLLYTNRSITPNTLAAFRRKSITKEDMIDLTMEEAINIYKKDFWGRRMQGHKMIVQNPILLDIIFNAICSSNGLKHLRETIKEMGGNVNISNKEVSDAEIELFNNLICNIEHEQEFYNRFFNKRKKYYLQRSKKFKGIAKWCEDYPENI